ncbi:MAG: holin [Bifidobacteriaceae bacterium]|jgi:hypothetical protein|nr:holin [Bifidobacteriaceae bacterium]
MSAAWWKDALERTVATAAETILALGGANLAGLPGLTWQTVLVTAGLAALAAFLKAVALVGRATPATGGPRHLASDEAD